MASSPLCSRGGRAFTAALQVGVELPERSLEEVCVQALANDNLYLYHLTVDGQLPDRVVDTVLSNGTAKQRADLTKAHLTGEQIDVVLAHETRKTVLNGIAEQAELSNGQARELMKRVGKVGLRQLALRGDLPGVQLEAGVRLLREHSELTPASIQTRESVEAHFSALLECDLEKVAEARGYPVGRLWHNACLAGVAISDQDTIRLARATGDFSYQKAEVPGSVSAEVSRIPAARPLLELFESAIAEQRLRQGAVEVILNDPTVLHARAIGDLESSIAWHPRFLEVFQSDAVQNNPDVLNSFCLAAQAANVPLTDLEPYVRDVNLLDDNLLPMLTCRRILEIPLKRLPTSLADQAKTLVQLAGERFQGHESAWSYFFAHCDEWDGTLGDYLDLCVALTD